MTLKALICWLTWTCYFQPPPAINCDTKPYACATERDIRPRARGREAFD